MIRLLALMTRLLALITRLPALIPLMSCCSVMRDVYGMLGKDSYGQAQAMFTMMDKVTMVI